MQSEFHKLFYTPVWRFHYPDFKQDQEYLVKYLGKDELYLKEREKNGLQITRANLHKDPQIQKLTDFIHECGKAAMSDMGYVPECAITSLWATRQRAQGYHHPHFHRNSFLGGAFHLFDLDGNASGTVMFNTESCKYAVEPAIDTSKEQMLQAHAIMPFIPGSFVMFPAWAMHLTQPTPCRYRIVVATNIMPVGKTNKDHFDRYNYPDPSNLDLKEYGE